MGAALSGAALFIGGKKYGLFYFTLRFCGWGYFCAVVICNFSEVNMKHDFDFEGGPPAVLLAWVYTALAVFLCFCFFTGRMLGANLNLTLHNDTSQSQTFRFHYDYIEDNTAYGGTSDYTVSANTTLYPVFPVRVGELEVAVQVWQMGLQGVDVISDIGGPNSWPVDIIRDVNNTADLQITTLMVSGDRTASFFAIAANDPLLVWRTSPDGVDYTDDSVVQGPVNMELYREGTAKIVGAIEKYSGGGAGGGTADPNWTNIGQELANEAAAKPSVATMQSGAAALQASLTSAYNSSTDTSLTGALTATSVSGGGSLWTLHLPIGFGNFIELDLNPAHYDFVVMIGSWFHLLLTVTILWLYESWVWAQFKGYMMGIVIVPQAHGNPLMMGTGAQATGLIAAALIGAVVVSLPGLLFACFGASFDVVGRLTSTEVIGSGAAWFDEGMALLERFIPVGLIVIVLAQVVLVKKAGLLIYGLASVGIKFFVP
jgi:hypothetical protein